jgi:RimJ/RimL family protein N-acetyltransferase
MNKNSYSNLKKNYTPGLNTKIIPFSPEYAKGIAQLTYAVYKNSYPVKSWYDEKQLISLHKKGDIHSVLGINEKNEVIGCMAMYKSSAPYHRLKEGGMMMTEFSYRGANLISEILAAFLDYFKNENSIEALYGESVCNHTITQKMSDSSGFKVTAVEAALVPPSESMGKESKTNERISCVYSCFIKSNKEPLKVYIPEIYENILMEIYSNLNLKRTFLKDSNKISSDKTISEIEEYSGPKVKRVNVSVTGADFKEFIEKSIITDDFEVIQVFICLSNPGVNNLCLELKNKGFYFGGIMPIWFGEDAILMQKTPPHFSEIKIYSDMARKILDFSISDYNDSQRLKNGKNL